MNATPRTAGPLAGLRILDMATVIAAPFAATLCADLGAEVIKLELPAGNDPLRTLAPVKGEHALHWKTTNRGKRGITLDVRKPAGKALLLRLLARVDVLVENFRTGTLDRWGLDIATLHAANPRLIVLRLTGFGQTGPYAQRPGFARIFEAMSGFAHLTGEPDGSPQHMNYPLGDMVAGLFGAFAIAAAVAGQRASRAPSPGCEIDLSATEAMLRLLDPLAAEYEQLGVVRQRTGSRATYTAPSNVYRSADGVWVSVVGTSEPVFARLCAAISQPELLTDPRFATHRARITHGLALDGLIAQWCASQSFQALSAALSAQDVPFSKVYAIDDVLADAHLRARAAIIRLPDAALGSVPAPCVVPRYSGTVTATPCTGPDLGEHNRDIFGELGLSEAELAQLQADAVI